MFSVLLPNLRTYSNADSWIFRGLSTLVHVYVCPQANFSYLEYISTAVVVQLCLKFVFSKNFMLLFCKALVFIPYFSCSNFTVCFLPSIPELRYPHDFMVLRFRFIPTVGHRLCEIAHRYSYAARHVWATRYALTCLSAQYFLRNYDMWLR